LRRCLEKEPKNRLHSAADVRIEIDECLGAADQDQAPVMAGPVAAPPRWQRVLPWALAAALLAALVAVLWPRAGTTARQVRFDVLLGGEAIRVDEETKDGVVAVISPDGQTLAYLGLRGNERRLYLRPLKGLEAAAVPGSERAYQPFFSADGREIAFFSDGTLKRAAVAGGAPTTVVPADDARGGAWGPDNTIVFAPTLMSVLMRVPASGGTPVELTKLGPNERTHRWPSILPDGKHVLFMCQLADGAYDDGTIEAARLDTGERKVLVRGGTAPLYVPGYLLYTRRKSLYAVRFDPERLETSGDARLVLAGVMSSGEGIGGGLGNGSSQVSIASSGTAVFIAGASASTVQDLQLSVLDRDGNPLYTHPGRRLFRDPRFSPDAKLVAVRVGDGQTEQIHVLDPSRGSLPKLTTVGTASVVPVWSRNGKLMAYSSDRAQPGGLEVFLMKSDGSGEPKHFASNGNASIATSFSQDDSMLLVSVVNPKTNMDLLTLSIADGKTAVFLQTPASEGAGQFSPDGKWVVYQSQEISGAPTSTSVFVCAYPGCTSRRQVSGDAGLLPFWTKNGTEIVYATPTPGGVTISAVGFRVVGGEVELGKPVPLFEKPMFSAPISTWYHASEDGTKFVVLLMNSSIVEPERRHVTVILNFLDEIRHVMERAK
jgi:Tol biopolymer transport system component